MNRGIWRPKTIHAEALSALTLTAISAWYADIWISRAKWWGVGSWNSWVWTRSHWPTYLVRETKRRGTRDLNPICACNLPPILNQRTKRNYEQISFAPLQEALIYSYERYYLSYWQRQKLNCCKKNQAHKQIRKEVQEIKGEETGSEKIHNLRSFWVCHSLICDSVSSVPVFSPFALEGGFLSSPLTACEVWNPKGFLSTAHSSFRSSFANNDKKMGCCRLAVNLMIFSMTELSIIYEIFPRSRKLFLGLGNYFWAQETIAGTWKLSCILE